MSDTNKNTETEKEKESALEMLSQLKLITRQVQKDEQTFKVCDCGGFR